MPFLNSIASIQATHNYEQDHFADRLLRDFPADDRRKYKWLLSHAGIVQRQCFIPDYLSDDSPLRIDGPATIQEKMVFFRSIIPQIIDIHWAAFLAQNNLLVDDITHLITVSCTGLSAPGIDFLSHQAMGLRSDCQRLSVNFMGCYAAFHALKMAYAIARSEPNAKIVIFDLELCSLHFQQKQALDDVLANGLFADGAALALVSNEPGGLEMLGFFQDTLADSQEEMAWQLSERHFEMKLSTYVPELIGENFKAFFDKNTMAAEPSFAIHPGGKKILEQAAMALGIDENIAFAKSFEVLREHGNMSSVTIFFVLHAYLKEMLADGHPIFAAAFGPGLTVEGANFSVRA